MSSKGSRTSLIFQELDELDDEFYSDVPIGLGCALVSFQESEEVNDILTSLNTIYNDIHKVEPALQRYTTILDRYQEQPHLLDKEISGWIYKLLTLGRDRSNPELSRVAFRFLRPVFKVRNPKEVVKKMPHEIADLVSVLEILESINIQDSSYWEAAYVLVYWLSILVMNPFDLKLLDGSAAKGSIAQRIMDICYKCSVLNNSIGAAVPTLVSKFLSRPDASKVYLKPFVDWACGNISSNVSFGAKLGAFSSLAAIYKHSEREMLLPYGEQILKTVTSCQLKSGDILLRKYAMKLVQRVGMTFLKTKVAPWRYQRGKRTLTLNVNTCPAEDKNSQKADSQNTVSTKEEESYEELEQYRESIENVLDYLLNGLKDNDTVVRWSAAKGIGRVTNRLPRDYADEVVANIMNNFVPQEGHQVWHGSCLATAELGRRGLLLPDRLSHVIPVIRRALVFDEIRGHFCVGAHVRDAACYVLWAFARAFEPKVLKPFMPEITTCLIITMVFDREVNCRRAAAAAFQENVGRQENVPHGLDIIGIADYFTVGNRKNAFTGISIQIGRYPEYFYPMVRHLVDMKFNHIDFEVREATGVALGRFTPWDPKFMVEFVIRRLLKSVLSKDIHTCHGALVSLGAVVCSLGKIGKLSMLDAEAQTMMKSFIPTLIKMHLSEQSSHSKLTLKLGLCSFIRSLSCSGIEDFNGDASWISTCRNFLEQMVVNEDSKLRETASEAINDFLLRFFFKNSFSTPEELRKIIDRYSEGLNKNNMSVRMGFSATLGEMDICLLKSNFQGVVNHLVNCSKLEETTILWAESRRDALDAISHIFGRLKIVDENYDDSDVEIDATRNVKITDLHHSKILEAIFQGLEDYTADTKRGDIGSWVRVSSMKCFRVVLKRLQEFSVKYQRDILETNIIGGILGRICKQCVESIDNIRVHAGMVFSSILSVSPPVNCIPKRAEVAELFPVDSSSKTNWRSSSETFPKFSQMLKYSEFTYPLLAGFCASGGGNVHSVMKDANAAVSDYLFARGSEEEERIFKLFIDMLNSNQKNDRVTVRLAIFLTRLLQQGLFSNIQDEFAIELIEGFKREVQRTKRVEKIFAVVELFCELIQERQKVAEACSKRLAVFLCHPYPRVRSFTASKFYEALLNSGDACFDSEKYESAVNILSTHPWTGALEDCKLARDKICDDLGIPEPISAIPSRANLLES